MRGLIDYSYPFGDLMAWITPPGRDQADTLRAMRADGRKRVIACRDAMVAWLCACDATGSHPTMRKVRDGMLAEPPYGVWFSEPFTPSDLGDAAAWLHRHEMVDGPTVEECDGPVQLWLTDDGIDCAENFDSDTRRYIAAKNALASSGPIVNIGTNSGPFQVAGARAQQVQNIGLSAEHLRELIAGLAEIVRQFVPDATDIEAQQQAALAAAGDGAVDQSVLKRFGAWVISVVRTGATAAIVSVVTSGTDDMLREASRLAGHL